MIGSASISPTPRSMIGSSWLRASGCRAIPSTVRDETSPSPTPAPMAPPAMINPAATSPAPMMIACSIPSSLRNCRLTCLVVFHRLPEVRDGEHGENEGLDRTDEDAEADPDDVEDEDKDDANDRQRSDQDMLLEDLADADQEAASEEGQYQQHDLAGEDVPEEPERERDGLGQ